MISMFNWKKRNNRIQWGIIFININMSKLTYNNWKEHTDSNDSNDDERREIWNHVCFKKWNSKEEKVEYDINQTIFRMQNKIEFVLSLQKKTKKKKCQNQKM